MTKKTLVTHNGTFHADDIFAVATLMLLHDDQISIVRTRDESVVDKADMVVDVGMEYDPSRQRFDHHQEGGAGARVNGIPYSSFGLVWKEYGEEICGDRAVAADIEERLVASIDALDNGVDTTSRVKDGYPFRYSISDVMWLYRPTWEEASEETLYAGFLKAVSLAKFIISREIDKLKSDFKAQEYIRSVYEMSQDKRILILDSCAPWEKVVSAFPETLFVVHPSLASDVNWSAEVVRDDSTTFSSNRISFPESWAGKREDELRAITGIDGAIFAHRARFKVVADSKQAVLALVNIALKEAGR